MSEAAVPRRMSADDFIAWAMEQPEGRHYELERGEIIAMAPERLSHAIVKGLFFRRMAEEAERLGLDGTALTDGMAVAIEEDTVYEPDAMLRCGPPLPPETTRLTDPLVVVEVRSRSTGSRDAGAKLEGYFRLASMRHYLIVKAEDQTIIHHQRRPDGTIVTSIVRDGAVTLDPPGIVLRDLFPTHRS